MAARLNRNAGFTLVELMVVVAIIAITAAIAYPSYTESVRKGQRASAKERMFDVHQAQSTHYSEKGTYTVSLTDLGFPATLQSQTKGHGITIVAGPSGIANGYRIVGTPVKPDPACNPLTLDSLGAYGPNKC